MASRAVRYTVFTAEGRPKVGTLGLIVFVRSLRAARLAMAPGDFVLGWSNSGDSVSRRYMRPDGTLSRG